MSALQWNVPGMNAHRAPRCTTARPVNVAQRGTRRLAEAICMTLGGAPFLECVLAGRPFERLRIQSRVEIDLDRVERSADRTVFLRALRQALILVCIDARCGHGGRQVDPRDHDALVVAAQQHGGFRVDGRRRVPVARERETERHRVARGVRGGEQLLGVRARVATEAGAERVVRGDEAALGGHGAFAARDVALPVDGWGARDVGWRVRDARVMRGGVGWVALSSGAVRAGWWAARSEGVVTRCW